MSISFVRADTKPLLEGITAYSRFLKDALLAQFVYCIGFCLHTTLYDTTLCQWPLALKELSQWLCCIMIYMYHMLRVFLTLLVEFNSCIGFFPPISDVEILKYMYNISNEESSVPEAPWHHNL